MDVFGSIRKKLWSITKNMNNNNNNDDDQNNNYNDDGVNTNTTVNTPRPATSVTPGIESQVDNKKNNNRKTIETPIQTKRKVFEPESPSERSRTYTYEAPTPFTTTESPDTDSIENTSNEDEVEKESENTTSNEPVEDSPSQKRKKDQGKEFRKQQKRESTTILNEWRKHGQWVWQQPTNNITAYSRAVHMRTNRTEEFYNMVESMGKYMVDDNNWRIIHNTLQLGCPNEEYKTTNVKKPAVRRHIGKGFEVFFNNDNRTQQESDAMDSILNKWMVNTHEGRDYSKNTSSRNKVKHFKNELKNWFEESVKHDPDYNNYYEEFGDLQAKIVSFIVKYDSTGDERYEKEKQIRVPVTGKMFIVPIYIGNKNMPLPVEYGNVRCTDSSKDNLPKLHMTANVKMATWLHNNWFDGDQNISDMFKKSILESFKTDLGTDLEKYYPLLAGNKLRKEGNKKMTNQVGTMIGV